MQDYGSLPHRQLIKTPTIAKLLTVCSLPHRQLRKFENFKKVLGASSLPHRQLRKAAYLAQTCDLRSLPHRQLRNEILQSDDVYFDTKNKTILYVHSSGEKTTKIAVAVNYSKQGNNEIVTAMEVSNVDFIGNVKSGLYIKIK